MALITDVSTILNIGDTSADLPVSPPRAGLFFDISTQTLQVAAEGTYYPTNAAFTSVTSITDLKAIPASSRYNGLVVLVTVSPSSQQQLFYFKSSSVLTGDDVLVIAPDAGTGRWLRVPGSTDIALPVSFSTASAATLYTMPTGSRFKLRDAYWQVLSAFTGTSGGGAAALGLSSSNRTGLTTKGDILGGASGDVLATLVTGVTAGTIGVGIDSVAKLHTAGILVPTNTIRADRFTDQFTGGSGYAHLVGDLLQNLGV